MDIKKYLPTIIIVGICLILFLSIYVFQYVSFNQRLQRETTLSYLKGKAETMIENSKYLIEKTNKSLEELKITLDDTKAIISTMKEVYKNVSETMHNFLNRLIELDNAYNTLYGAWSNSKRH
jgi:uncharacterized protein YoxC